MILAFIHVHLFSREHSCLVQGWTNHFPNRTTPLDSRHLWKGKSFQFWAVREPLAKVLPFDEIVQGFEEQRPDIVVDPTFPRAFGCFNCVLDELRHEDVVPNGLLAVPEDPQLLRSLQRQRWIRDGVGHSMVVHVALVDVVLLRRNAPPNAQDVHLQAPGVRPQNRIVERIIGRVVVDELSPTNAA